MIACIRDIVSLARLFVAGHSNASTKIKSIRSRSHTYHLIRCVLEQRVQIKTGQNEALRRVHLNAKRARDRIHTSDVLYVHKLRHILLIVRLIRFGPEKCVNFKARFSHFIQTKKNEAVSIRIVPTERTELKATQF